MQRREGRTTQFEHIWLNHTTEGSIVGLENSPSAKLVLFVDIFNKIIYL